VAHPQRYVLDQAIIGTGDAQKAKDAALDAQIIPAKQLD
jgi:hypothetical protein